MKIALLTASLALAACADTGVMQVGPNRYRITQDSFWTSGTAETSVIREAHAYCAARGQTADIRVTDTRPAVAYRHYAGASADFSCVAP